MLSHVLISEERMIDQGSSEIQSSMSILKHLLGLGTKDIRNRSDCLMMNVLSDEMN